MDRKHKITITTRDRLLRAWENSMEMVRDFELYSSQSDDDPAAARMFDEYARDEAFHASSLHERLLEYESKGTGSAQD